MRGDELGETFRHGNNMVGPGGVREHEGLLADARKIWESCFEEVGRD